MEIEKINIEEEFIENIKLRFKEQHEILNVQEKKEIGAIRRKFNTMGIKIK